MPNFIKPSATVHELSPNREKNLATMLKTILPSFPRAVKIVLSNTILRARYHVLVHGTRPNNERPP